MGRLHHAWRHSSWHSVGATWGTAFLHAFWREGVINSQEHAGGFCGGFNGLLFHPEWFDYVIGEHVSDLAGSDLDLLTMRNYEPELEVPIRYGGVDYRADLLIRSLGAIIEVKLSRKKEDVRKIMRQINSDKLAYLSHQRWVIFVVFDLGRIRNTERFEKEVEAGEERIICKVISA
jgi:hypothetical protein